MMEGERLKAGSRVEVSLDTRWFFFFGGEGGGGGFTK